MLVKDLIEKLRMCEPDAIVLYSLENTLNNGAIPTAEDCEFGIDDVLIGNDNEKGFVYLTDNKYER